MSTYSHVSVVKRNAGKNSRRNGKRKSNKYDPGIAATLPAGGINSVHVWYSSKAYPVLAD